MIERITLMSVIWLGVFESKKVTILVWLSRYGRLFVLFKKSEKLDCFFACDDKYYLLMFDEVVCAWTNICYDLKYVIEVALCDKMYVFYTIFSLFVNYVPEEVIIDLNILLQVWNVGHENHLHIYVKVYLDWYCIINLT